MVTTTNNDIRTIAFQRRQRAGFVINGDVGDLTANDLKRVVADLIDLQSQITASPTKKLSYTIGAPGVAGTDYNFTSAANMTEQSIQLGAAAIIPALSIVTGIMATCSTGVNGAITMSVDMGLTSGSDEFLSAIDLDDTDEIASVGQVVTAAVAASSIYFSGTPDANWDTMTTGVWTIHIYYADGSV